MSTVVTYGRGVFDALTAAEQLAAEGIDVEVLDLRTWCRSMCRAVLESVGKTKPGRRRPLRDDLRRSRRRGGRHHRHGALRRARRARSNGSAPGSRPIPAARGSRQQRLPVGRLDRRCGAADARVPPWVNGSRCASRSCRWRRPKRHLVEWLVADGDDVADGQALYVVETDKVETEVEAATSGVIHHGAPAGQDISGRHRDRHHRKGVVVTRPLPQRKSSLVPPSPALSSTLRPTPSATDRTSRSVCTLGSGHSSDCCRGDRRPPPRSRCPRCTSRPPRTPREVPGREPPRGSADVVHA